MSDEPTAMKRLSDHFSCQAEFQVPGVEKTGDKPAMYDKDSVSTFRSHAQGKQFSSSEKMPVSFEKVIIIDEETQVSAGRSQIPLAVHEYVPTKMDQILISLLPRLLRLTTCIRSHRPVAHLVRLVLVLDSMVKEINRTRTYPISCSGQPQEHEIGTEAFEDILTKKEINMLEKRFQNIDGFSTT